MRGFTIALGLLALCVGVLVYFLTVTLRDRSATSAAPGSSQQLLVGAYRNDGPGGFRRIIVPTGGAVAYDIWRVTPGATLQHLHFDLISPVQPPVESNSYSVRSNGKDCGRVGLHFYRGPDGKVLPFILVFRYDGLEQPLDWAGHATTQADLEADRAEVARLAESAGRSNFYRSLNRSSRDALAEFVPCGVRRRVEPGASATPLRIKLTPP